MAKVLVSNTFVITIMCNHTTNVLRTFLKESQLKDLNAKYEEAMEENRKILVQMKENAVKANNNAKIYNENMREFKKKLNEKEKEIEILATSSRNELSSDVSLDFDGDLPPEKKYLQLQMKKIPFNFHFKDKNLELIMSKLQDDPEFQEYVKTRPKAFSSRDVAANYVMKFMENRAIYGGGNYNNIKSSLEANMNTLNTFLELRAAVVLSCIDTSERKLAEYKMNKKRIDPTKQTDIVMGICKDHLLVLGFAGFHFLFFPSDNEEPLLVSGDYKPLLNGLVRNVLRVIKDGSYSNQFMVDSNEDSYSYGCITGMHNTVTVESAENTFHRILKKLICNDAVEHHLRSGTSMDAITNGDESNDENATLSNTPVSK